MFRWGYTAVTRATDELWMLKPPISITSWIPKFWTIDTGEVILPEDMRDPHSVKLRNPIHATIHEWLLKFMDVESEEDLLTFTGDYSDEEYQLSEGKKLELCGISGNPKVVSWYLKQENHQVQISIYDVNTRPRFEMTSPLGSKDLALQRLCYRIFGVGQFIQ